MIKWPSPARPCAFSRSEAFERQNEEAILRLAEGPPDVKAKPYLVGVGGPNGTIQHYYPQACWDYFPNAGAPTHLLVWTPTQAIAFDYYGVEFCTEKFDPTKIPAPR